LSESYNHAVVLISDSTVTTSISTVIELNESSVNDDTPDPTSRVTSPTTPAVDPTIFPTAPKMEDTAVVIKTTIEIKLTAHVINPLMYPARFAVNPAIYTPAPNDTIKEIITQITN